jgi:transcription-repair coupling factor (superfamily II helicase)
MVTEFGYTKVHRIEREHEWQHRGDILDIWIPNTQHITRIMFLGDEIEEIKLVDANSFATIKAIKSCVITPIKETCTIENYQTVLELLKEKTQTIVLEQQNKLLIWADTKKKFESKSKIEIKTAPVANFFSALSVLVPEILWNIKTRRKTVVLYTGTSKALERYLDTKGINYNVTTTDAITPNAINIIHKGLGVSFELTELNTVVYSVGTPGKRDTQPEQTIFGQENLYENNTDFEVPREGSLVVHEKHGLGRFVGKKKMNLAENVREYLVLQYDGGTFVYVPTDQMHLLYNYYGPIKRLDRI